MNLWSRFIKSIGCDKRWMAIYNTKADEWQREKTRFLFGEPCIGFQTEAIGPFETEDDCRQCCDDLNDVIDKMGFVA